MTTLKGTTHRARKPHVCYWCGTHLLIGMNYYRWTCVNEDEVFTRIKTHPECKRAWDESELSNDEEAVRFGEHKRGCLCEAGCPACQE